MRPSLPASRGPRNPSSRTFRDLDGFVQSCRRERELGHLGRAAIHPDQLELIEQAYLPDEHEVEQAKETIDRLETLAVGTIAEKSFIDVAMLGAARQVLEIATQYGTREP
jgi:citrate lyase subunit beta / citryl-CoA lyase